MNRAVIVALVGCAVLIGSPGVVVAQDDDRFELGLRGLIILGDGQPSNDMTGVSVAGRIRWRTGWYFGVALDSITFDYERPYEVLGISSTAEIDGTNDLRRLSGWLERRYERNGRMWHWFWIAGLGLASIDAETVRGSTPSGATFEIATEAKDEMHWLFGAGARRPVASRWAFEAALDLEHHNVDYKLVDRASGATGSIGSQTPIGLSVAISRRF